MRAAACLKALSVHCDIHLLVVPVADPDGERHPDDWDAHCTSARLVAMPRVERALAGARSRMTAFRADSAMRLPLEKAMASRRMVGKAFRCFSSRTFDRIFVFRAYMVPFAQPYIDANPRAVRHLDLDDIESLTRQRLADLHASNGNADLARRLEGEAAHYRTYERDITPEFDSVSVCSLRDRDRLSARLGLANLEVLQNIIGGIGAYHPPPERPPFNFLFVGNLGYFPNQDAIRFFMAQILPRIRAGTDVPVRFTLVGSGDATWAREMAAAGCDIVGWVEDLAAYYRAAHAVVVPLRAGGGTRIKILEAFSQHRPVVSTGIGAEGLDVRQERELLLADTPDDFAAQCLRLIHDTELSASLTGRAARLLDERYTGVALDSVLARVLRIP